MISFAIATLSIMLFGYMSMQSPRLEEAVEQVQPEMVQNGAALVHSSSVEVVHIFIHGSTHVQLAFLSPFQVFFRHLQGNSWYERTHQTLRSKRSTMQGGMVLAQGITDVTDWVCSAQVLHESVQSKAAYHILRVFHAYKGSEQDRQRYIAFGWSGVMCDNGRKAATEQLYQFLVDYKRKRAAQGVMVEFHLYAFSHGGQIALRLPFIREERKEYDLHIERLVLSAVPLYYDTARSILLGMFRHVINLYSRGDVIQTLDRFTTSAGVCYQTIAESIPLPRVHAIRISDVDVTINHRYFPHHKSFFDLHYTALYPCRSRRSEKYRTRYVAAYSFIEHLNPFPLLVLYPHIIPLLTTLQHEVYQHWTVDFAGTADSITMHMMCQQRHAVQKEISPAILQQARTQLVESFNAHRVASQWDLTLTELLCAAQTLFT